MAQGTTTEFDVIVIGFGPGGEVATSLLSQAGHRVLAIDKAQAPYGQPRMSVLDGELARVLQHASDPKEAMRESLPSKVLLQFGADGEPLPAIDLNFRISGHWRAYSMHQPNIENAMERRIAATPSAEFHWGWRAASIRQHGDVVTVEMTRVDEPAVTRTATARYVLGFDGASSFTRAAAGIELDVLHLHDDRWILTDFDALRPLPPIAMTAQFRMDPARPWFASANGMNRCRIDVRVLDGEDMDAAIADEDGAYAFMEEKFGLTRQDLKMTRRVGYRFRSQMARTFRNGRIFIGGDAAHAMPPYMGQGANCAMRDAANLAWKLRLVLSGAAAEALLDSYETERLPQSTYFVRGSLATLQFVNEVDPRKAAERDANVRAGLVKFPPTPGLVAGVLRHDRDGGLAPYAGRLAPQGVVRRGTDEGLLDDLVGYGGQLVSHAPLADRLSSGQIDRLAELGVQILQIGGDGEAPIVDLDGSYREFWATAGAVAFLARADHHLFGVAGDESDIAALVADFLRQVPRAEPALVGVEAA